MGMNKSTGNMYKFIDYTWNTIKGECPHGCSYCYMHRWGKQSALHFDDKELRTDLGHGKYIFVGSSCDMFAESIPSNWINDTLSRCFLFSDNLYFFQSKNPGKMYYYIESILTIPDQSICTTIETNRFYPEIMHNSPIPTERAEAMKSIRKGYKKYVTIEPIIDFDLPEMIELIKMCEPVQVNIGADSGNNNLPEPSKEKILRLINELKTFTNVNIKENIRRIIK
jgi:DNA repair photolyase